MAASTRTGSLTVPPQEPQLLVSVCRFLQEPPHRVEPGGHTVTVATVTVTLVVGAGAVVVESVMPMQEQALE